MEATFRFLTKADSVAEQLRNEILHGSLRPGAQLEQADVAKRFGVSITPVREAFGVLEAEGLLERRPHRGVVVAKLEYADAEDLYEIRRILELQSIVRAVKVINETVIERLEHAIENSEAALRHPELHSFREMCAQFHEALVEASGSKVYSEVTKGIIRRTLFFVPLDTHRMTEVVSEHRAMIKALRDRDVRSTQLILDRHLKGSVRSLRQRYPPTKAELRAPLVAGSPATHNGFLESAILRAPMASSPSGSQESK